MLKISETTDSEAKKLLEANNYGHLGCSLDHQPYIVPMNYAFDGEHIFLFTTGGLKTEWLTVNPKVCFQVEQVRDGRHWQSVIVTGCAELLTHFEDIGRAANFIVKNNSLLTPALNQTTVGGVERNGSAAVYRIHIASITGRKTVRAQEELVKSSA
jgi:uncharacterized protein